MGVDKAILLRLKIDSQAQTVQNDQRLARNRMVIGRMPEDRSKTFKNMKQKPSNTSKAIST
eukprot:5618405-Heterocapsa_arctica.AAC.1